MMCTWMPKLQDENNTSTAVSADLEVVFHHETLIKVKYQFHTYHKVAQSRQMLKINCILFRYWKESGGLSFNMHVKYCFK